MRLLLITLPNGKRRFVGSLSMDVGLARCDRDLPLQLLLNLWTGIARSLSEWIFKDWDVLSQMERTQRGDVAFETLQRVIGIAGQEVPA